MTKKDFERIAEIVASVPFKAEEIRKLSEHVSNELATHEPRFDSEKFESYVMTLLLKRSLDRASVA